jgi:hypothetical protein
MRKLRQRGTACQVFNNRRRVDANIEVGFEKEGVWPGRWDDMQLIQKGLILARWDGTLLVQAVGLILEGIDNRRSLHGGRGDMNYSHTRQVRHFLMAIMISAWAALCLSCNGGQTMTEMVPDSMMGWERLGPVETYDRETIFDYINGAGEVYLAYGFSEVQVYRFARPENPEISVEVFHMGSDHDAYGVFSHSRMEEQTGIGSGYEYRGSVLCFWKGSYLVCVMADKQTDESKEAVFALARAVADTIEESGKKPELLRCLPKDGLDRGSVRYFHNHASLNYHYFLAEENVLMLSDETEAVMGVYEPGNIHLVCIRYDS